jgi:DNA-binding transcriptional LysR family regulator
MDMPPNLRQLQHALLLDAERHFARAAQRANLSTSAFSRSISELEQSLGVKLFDRTLKRVTPTAFGRVLVEHGAAVLRGAADLQREIHLLAGLETGSLAIAAGLYAGSTTVPRALADMLRAHPGVQIRLTLLDPDEVAEEVLAGRVDVGVADVKGLESETRLNVERLPPLRTYLACRPGHPLTQGGAVTVARAAAYPLATTLLRDDAAIVASQGRVLPAAGNTRKVRLPPPVMVNSLSAARLMALGCDATFIAPFEFLAEDLAAGRLVTLPLDLPVFYTTYGITTLVGRSLSPAASLFIDTLRAKVAQALRDEQAEVEPRKAGRRR